MANTAAYKQMVKVAQQLNWPESYATDLYVVDRGYMESPFAPARFGWIIWSSGTAMSYDRLSIPSVDFMVRRSGQLVFCYWYDGERLRPVSPAALKSELASMVAVKWSDVGDSEWLRRRWDELYRLEAERLGKERYENER